MVSRRRDTTRRETLLPRVLHLLGRIHDEDERDQLEQFFHQAALTIEELGLLDIDAMAARMALPEQQSFVLGTIRSLLDRIESLVFFVKAVFPVDEPNDDIDIQFALDDTDEYLSKEPEGTAERGINQSLNAFAWSIGNEVRTLGQNLPSSVQPAMVVPFMTRVDQFRGRVRSGLGEMFFAAVQAHAVVRREDVVPFYKEDLEISLALRRAITLFRTRLGVKKKQLFERMARGDQVGLRHSINGLIQLLLAFMETEEFRNLQGLDRNSCWSIRGKLEALLSAPHLPQRLVETNVDGLSKFVDSLNLVNQRELLVAHDRETIRSTYRQLDLIEEAVGNDDLARAQQCLKGAVGSVSTLFGRDPSFDGLLKLLHHVQVGALGIDDILALTGLIRCHATME